MLVEKLKTKYDYNEPIFTNEILDLFKEYSRAYVFRLIAKAEKQGQIIRFDAGVYYMPTKNIIGISTITVDDVVKKKYIGYKDDIYGVYSGLNVQNMFSFTTQMSNTIEIVSNKETMRCRRVIMDGRTIILRKSRCLIDKTNAGAYTILQLLTEVGKNKKIGTRERNSILKYMQQNKVNKQDLLSLVGFFPAQTAKNLINGGLLYDITR